MADKNTHFQNHHASREWLLERFAGLVSIPLLIWLVVNLVLFSKGHYASFGAFVGEPVNMGLIIALLFSFALYTFLAMKVVYEDYIHNLCVRHAAIYLTAAADIAAFLVGTVSLIHIYRS